MEEWERRLQDWGVYRASQGKGSCAISSAYDGMFGDGAPRPPLPPLGEVNDTDSLVVKLADELQKTLIVKYVWTVVPDTEEARAAALRIHVNTLRERVKQAKFRLDDLDHARKASIRRFQSPMLGWVGA